MPIPMLMPVVCSRRVLFLELVFVVCSRQWPFLMLALAVLALGICTWHLGLRCPCSFQHVLDLDMAGLPRIGRLDLEPAGWPRAG